MTTFISGESLSDLRSYEGLKTAIQKWLERSDLIDQIPDFIRLAEARFRRELVMPDMEKVIAIAPAASVTLPDDFDSIRAIGIPGYPALDQLSLSDFNALPTQPNGFATTGRPTKFAIVAGAFGFWPTPDQPYALKLTYRANLPSLSTGIQTNWLLLQHPDVYLFGALLQAEFYGWNDDRLPLIKGAVDEILSSITVSGTRKRYGGQLAMKPATAERIGLR